MPTVSVNLSTTAYVQVNTGFNPMLLQAHRDSVRVVVNETQPALNNAVFHKLGGEDPILHLNSLDTNVWVLAISDDSSLIVTQTEPFNVALFDGNNNPLSSYYNAVTDQYILNIHDADVHNAIVNKYMHQHTAIATTLIADTLGDGTVYQINVADSTGFAVNDFIHIDTTSVETTHPKILAITPLTPPAATFTLDRRLDKAHLIGDAVTKSIINMASQAGTLATPQEYFGGPEAGEIFHITRLLFEITHTTAGDLGKFGDLNPLTNGVLLRAKINNQYYTLTNWKTSADIKVDMFDVVFDSRSTGGGTYSTTGRGTFKNAGAVLRLDAAQGDKFELYVQDDLTNLLTFTMKIQGHIEGA